MKTRIHPAANPRGFTLLEMMLVVVIIGVLATVAAVSLLGRGDAAKIAATKASMTTVDRMIKAYNLDYSAFPATLEVLVPKYLDKKPKDAWKHEFEYFVNSTITDGRPYTFFSRGKDGQTGGNDDLNIWTLEEDTGGQ